MHILKYVHVVAAVQGPLAQPHAELVMHLARKSVHATRASYDVIKSSQHTQILLASGHQVHSSLP